MNILRYTVTSSRKGKHGFGVRLRDFIICYSEGYKRGNIHTSQRETERERENEREGKSPRDEQVLFQGLVVGESVYRGERVPPLQAIFKSDFP